MKSRILTISFLFQVTMCLSQSLVTNDKEWSNLKVDDISRVSTEYIKFTNDTIINGLTYKFVERSIDKNQLNWAFYGLIREDSNKKIFYKPNPSEPERIFYDFNLGLNDTITAYSVLTSLPSYIGIQSQFFHVLSIDSILIGESYRKQINLAWPGDTVHAVEHWIDSTGNMGGILHTPIMDLVGQDSYALLCFTENGIVKYHNWYFDSCWVTTGTSDAKINDLSLTVFPNPLSEPYLLSIENHNNPMENIIDFYDLPGRKLLSATFRKEIKLDMSSFMPGLYMFKLYNQSGKSVSGKILIK